jgi:hypothetical protein
MLTMPSTMPAVPDNVARSPRAQRHLIDELDTLQPKDFKKLVKAWSVDDLTSAGTGLIHFYTKLDETKTDVLRALAKVVVALRAHYRTPDGDVDWRGSSWDYRQTVGAMYVAAGIPPDSESNIQASLRYHVGNLLREVAPADQLAAVGLLTNSPKERMNNVRHATAALLHELPVAEGGTGQQRRKPSAAEVVNRTVMGLYSLLSSLEHNPAIWDGLQLRAAEEYDETLEELNDKLTTVRDHLATSITAKWEQ